MNELSATFWDFLYILLIKFKVIPKIYYVFYSNNVFVFHKSEYFFIRMEIIFFVKYVLLRTTRNFLEIIRYIINSLEINSSNKNFLTIRHNLTKLIKL